MVRNTVITARLVFSETVKFGRLKPTMPRPNSLSTMVSTAFVRPVNTMGTAVERLVAPNNPRFTVRLAFVIASSMIPIGNVLLPVSPSRHVSVPCVFV